MGKLLGVFVPMLILATAASGEASANIELYDNATWKATALADGYSVHPYTGLVTITTYTTTIEIVAHDEPGAPFIVYDPVVDSYQQVGLPSISGSFFFGSECVNNPGCLITNLTELHIVFDTPIHGIQFQSFAISSELFMSPPGVQFTSENPDGQWFSLLGEPFSELAFYTGVFTDSPNSLYLSNIVVATAPEPATLGIFVGCLPFVIKRTTGKKKRSAPDAAASSYGSLQKSSRKSVLIKHSRAATAGAVAQRGSF